MEESLEPPGFSLEQNWTIEQEDQRGAQVTVGHFDKAPEILYEEWRIPLHRLWIREAIAHWAVDIVYLLNTMPTAKCDGGTVVVFLSSTVRVEGKLNYRELLNEKLVEHSACQVIT